MIILKDPWLSITAHDECQVCSIGCACLQNWCQLHQHAAEGVLTWGCTFISWWIWNKILIVLAILGICTKIGKLIIGKKRMYIYISGWHTFDSESSISNIIARRCRWHSSQRWRRFWTRCTGSLAPPEYLPILSGAILARKAHISLIFTNHCRVSFHCSLHCLIPRKLHSALLLIVDFSVRFLDQALHFLFWGM